MHGQKKQTVPAAGTCWARLRYCPCCRHMHPCQAAHCCTALPITARLPRASTRLVGHQDAFRVGAATGRLGIISHQSGDVARPCRCIDGLRACVYSGMKQRGGAGGIEQRREAEGQSQQRRDTLQLAAVRRRPATWAT